MNKIKKILVPTDFSNGSEKAYPVAQKIASAFGGTVDFLHVIPTVKYLNESMKKLGVPFNMEEDVYPKIITESEHRLEKALKSYISDANRGEFFVKIDRKASATITEHAKANNYDLILMGVKGKDETSMFRGGTTERVIRNASIPVFSVDERFDENNIENILVPTDSSYLSFAAFPFAVQLADTFQSDLTLLHVLELYGSISEDIPRDPDKGELLSIYEGLIKRLNEYLIDSGVDDIHIQRTGVTYEDEVVLTEGGESRTLSLYTKIEYGVSAHFEIENYAEEHADLVVMTTHGYSGLAHLLLGSTAEKVTQYVRKPVITIRPDKKQFKDSSRVNPS
ncbi:MAG: universal stress protein [Balneolaceae bacterium]